METFSTISSATFWPPCYNQSIELHKIAIASRLLLHRYISTPWQDPHKSINFSLQHRQQPRPLPTLYPVGTRLLYWVKPYKDLNKMVTVIARELNLGSILTLVLFGEGRAIFSAHPKKKLSEWWKETWSSLKVKRCGLIGGINSSILLTPGP